MKQYQKLLKKILKKGVEKESGRANMPNTIGIEYGKITMDLRKGFPLLTTKEMFWKGIVHELLWFLRGETNIKYLVDNGVNIWNGDAYRWYDKWWNESGFKFPKYSQEEFVEQVKLRPTTEKWHFKNGEIKQFIDHYTVGDLGKVYGYQWRNQNGVDQIADIIDGLKTNPYSRYHILDGWNKADFRDMALPPCHLLYQFIVKPMSIEDRWELFQEYEWQEPLGQKSAEDDELHRICDNHGVPRFYLNVNMYQRSCDTFLGVPFNLASMSLLLMIIAKTVNMVPLKARWIGGDVHLYKDHIPVVEEQLKREPKYLPRMVIKKDLNSLEDIESLTIDDFELQDYVSHGKLKAKLFTGNKL
jgi:thymidylate synthase